MNRLKKISLHGLLIFLGLSLTLVMIEGGVRLYQHLTKPISDKECRQLNELLHHSLVPNSSCRSRTKEWDIEFKVNSLGLRDYEYSKKKPDETFRILMLGDSFTEGYGVKLEETFSKLIEKQLRDRFDRKVEVINAGITGYSPFLEYIYLKNKGLELDPDLVVLNYSMTDYYDDWSWQKKLLTQVEDGQKWREEKLFTEAIPQTTWIPFMPKSWKWWLHRNFVSYNFIVLKLKKIFNSGIYKDNLTDYQKGEIDKDQLAITRDEIGKTDYAKLMTNTQDILMKIKWLLEKNNIDYLITIIPYGHQVNRIEWGEGRDYWKFEKGQVYSTKCIKELEAFARLNNIKVINLLDTFQSNDQLIKYFPYDGHWNTNGHQVAAKAILPVIENLIQ